jgi:hypothetical protein
MTHETVGDLTTSEFDQLIEDFILREEDRIPPSAFLTAMAKLEQRHGLQDEMRT